MNKNLVKAAMIMGAYLSTAMITSCSKDPAVRQQNYALAANGGSGVTGSVNIAEESTKAFSISLTMDKSEKDTLHLVKLYSGRVNQPGAVVLDLGTVKGTGSFVSLQKYSLDSIQVNGQKKAMSYDSIINYNGYIQVLFSATKPDSVLSRGNIGNQ